MTLRKAALAAMIENQRNKKMKRKGTKHKRKVFKEYMVLF